MFKPIDLTSALFFDLLLKWMLLLLNGSSFPIWFASFLPSIRIRLVDRFTYGQSPAVQWNIRTTTAREWFRLGTRMSDTRSTYAEVGRMPGKEARA